MIDPNVAGQFCAGKIRHFEREVFGVLFMDTRHRLLAFELMFYGTLDGSEVHPREVARAGLLCKLVRFQRDVAEAPSPLEAQRCDAAALDCAVLPEVSTPISRCVKR